MLQVYRLSMQHKTARVLDKAVVLVATLILAASTYQFPSKAFWDTLLTNRPYMLIILLAILGVFGALTPVESLSARSRIERSVTIRRQILNSFGRLLAIGNKVDPPIGINDLGLHIWRRRRTFKHPLRGILTRVATYRVGTNPVNRPFSPPQGVGVVGLCWKLDQEVGVDVEQLASSLTTEQAYAQHIQQHGPDSVMNLSWEEFNRVKHRGSVFACPIRDGRNKFVGCLSVDASHGFTTLDNQELKEQMSLLCIVIGQDGFENT